MSESRLSDVTTTEPMTHRQRLEALSGLLLVLFVAMLSANVVAIALPQILGALNGSQTQYVWVVTATLLTATVATPIWGKLADLFDKKRLVQAAIFLFALGSLACGFSQNAGQLIAARAFQGIGVGGLQALIQVVIAAMIPPRERGRYNGYLGAVMAVATVGGPLLGGLIVDVSWLGWRWCFFIGVPVALAGSVVLQATLRVPTIRRENVTVDYLGAALIAVGVSVLLIWVSFVGRSFDWLSWQTAAMVGGALAVLALAVLVESRVAEPVVPLRIVATRNTALAILASVAVGMAMFGGAVFLGQYFQIGRHYSATQAGLLTTPMMAGVLVSSVVSGRIITRTGRVKAHIVLGTSLLVVGFALLGLIRHDTSLLFIGLAMALVGIGVGMTMQNLILAVQNGTALKDVGAASSAVTFFRSLGATIGVTVLGAVLNRLVVDRSVAELAKAGVPVRANGAGAGNLNLEQLPDPVELIIRTVYGDVTGHVFLISAGLGVVSVIAAILLRPVVLRSTLDLAVNDGEGTAERKQPVHAEPSSP